MAQTSPSHACAHQHLLLPGPKESNTLQPLVESPQYPQNSPSWRYSLCLVGKSGFVLSRNLWAWFSCYSKPRTPMVLNKIAFCSCRGFPYREIGTRDAAVHLHHKSPNPELRCTRALIPCHVTSSLHSIGNCRIAISLVTFPLQNKIPNAES